MSYVLNSGVTESNLTKFLQDVQKLLPITLLISDFQSVSAANVMNEDRHQIAGESRQKLVYEFQRHKLQDYWTEVHQICTQCNLIIALNLLKADLRLSSPLSNTRAKSKGRDMRHLRTSTKFNWLP